MAVSRIIEKLGEFNRDESGYAPPGISWVLGAAALAGIAMLQGCAIQPSIPPAEQIASVCGTAPGYMTSTQIVCGSNPPPAPRMPPAPEPAAFIPPPAPVPPPPPAPVRATPIEYVEGQPMVRIGVPGVSFLCVLDTGASDLVMPYWMVMKIYDTYGLEYKYLGANKAQLANGSVVTTAKIMLREITIGPWRLTNVPVGVNLSMQGDCLLGMSVLKTFGHPMIDFASQRLILED